MGCVDCFALLTALQKSFTTVVYQTSNQSGQTGLDNRKSIAKVIRNSDGYLKHFREEAGADFLTEEIVNARQTGHGAPQSPVRGRTHPVRPVKPVQRGLAEFLVIILIHYDGQAVGTLTQPSPNIHDPTDTN